MTHFGNELAPKIGIICLHFPIILDPDPLIGKHAGQSAPKPKKASGSN